jgi:hypothetical protein
MAGDAYLVTFHCQLPKLYLEHEEHELEEHVPQALAPPAGAPS